MRRQREARPAPPSTSSTGRASFQIPDKDCVVPHRLRAPSPHLTAPISPDARCRPTNPHRTVAPLDAMARRGLHPMAHTSEASPDADPTCTFLVRHLLPSYFDAPLSKSRYTLPPRTAIPSAMGGAWKQRDLACVSKFVV